MFVFDSNNECTQATDLHQNASIGGRSNNRSRGYNHLGGESTSKEMSLDSQEGKINLALR